MAGLVIIGRTKSPIVEKIATHLNAPVVGFHLDWFADTEPSLTLERQELLNHATTIVVFQIDLMFEHELVHRSINDHVAGLLHLISAAKQADAKSITTVLPYLPYARQEKDATATHQGPLSMWATVFKTAGIDRLVTCDIHSPTSAACFGTMLYEISVTHFWAEHIKGIVAPELDLHKNLCIVSPDHGGLMRVSMIAKELGCPYTFVDKVRIAKDNPIALGMNGGIHGKIAVIVDDILDTGHTATNACQLLHAHGVHTVMGCFTHAIFSPEASQRLAMAGFEKILITDTLTSAIKQEGVHLQLCSIADYLAEGVCGIIETKIK